MDMGTCCAYFCTGVSAFGIMTLAVISVVLNGDGAHYIAEEFSHWEGPGDTVHASPKKAAQACMYAIGIYALFLAFCGYKVYNIQTKGAAKAPAEE